jgi:hypothetical protein
MALVTLTPSQQAQAIGAPMIGPGAASMNGQAGYNGAAGQSLQPIAQALMQAKMRQKLAGQLPGTTGQAPGVPAMPAAAAPGYFAPPQQPLSLGGTPAGAPGVPTQ